MSHQVISKLDKSHNRYLPKRECDHFKSVLRYYECKQYKKGLKYADIILKKYPHHGETLCMKGLIVHYLGRKVEAMEFVKMGLRNDMRSHVCWHIYGLLYRSDRRYNEAIKAYKQALKIDTGNLQILRDLSLLQVQMRDLHGFLQTRHTILTLKPNQKINWIAFALAKHLTADTEGAIQVIDAYTDSLENDSVDFHGGYECSELLLYRNSLLSEIPDNWRNALNHLDSCKDNVIDKIAWWKAKGYYELMLGIYDHALTSYTYLWNLGCTEDYTVHSGCMCALLQVDADICRQALKLPGTGTLANMIPLTKYQKNMLAQKYKEEWTVTYPWSQAMERVPITLFEGRKYICALDQYTRKRIIKGVPSLGSDLAGLLWMKTEVGSYALALDHVDIQLHPTYNIVGAMVDIYIESLCVNGTLPSTQDLVTNLKNIFSCNNNEDGNIYKQYQCDDEDTIEIKLTTKDNQSLSKDIQPTSTLLWVYYLRAVWYELGGSYTQAIQMADLCLNHMPTTVDSYELKGRLMHAAGDFEGAAEMLDRGREIDFKDRCINNQTALFYLRSNKEDIALERMSLFTKHNGNPDQNIVDMQCIWYELELAACWARKRQWGKSLKQYLHVIKHFEDFHEDQFDFHAYCVRKVTLRAYIQMLRWQDGLLGHDFYCAAAEGIIRNYLYLHENSKSMSSVNANLCNENTDMTLTERKKRKNKMREQKKVKVRQSEVKKQEERKGKFKTKNDGINNEIVYDPDGNELLKLDALVESAKYCCILVRHGPHRYTTWMLRYDVAMIRGKKVMALQALFHAKKLDPHRSELFDRIMHFVQNCHGSVYRNGLTEDNVSLCRDVKNVLNYGMNELLAPYLSIQEFVKNAAIVVKRDPMTPLKMRVSVCRAYHSFECGSVEDAASLIISAKTEGRGVNVDTCREALRCLKEIKEDAEYVSIWEEWIKSRYPFAFNYLMTL